jgi:predicted nucleic acid-binding protein
MANYLLDTNVLLRMSDSTSSVNLLAGIAAATLLKQHHQLFITSQNIIEFWVVATRPINVNGLGWRVEKTLAEIEQILNQFPQLEETPQVFFHWLNLVTAYQIQGKRVHDARLVAVMLAHGVTHLLTFNPNDFKSINDIVIVHPQVVLELQEWSRRSKLEK